MKEPPPGYMPDIQGKINVFTANLHPLILLPGIIKGFSDTTVSVRPVEKSCVCVCVLVSVLFCSMLGVQCAHYTLFVCGRGGDREGGYHSWQFWQTCLASSDRFSTELCVRVFLCVCVCVGVHVYVLNACAEQRRGRVGWRSQEGAVLGYTTQQTYWMHTLIGQQLGTWLGACVALS